MAKGLILIRVFFILIGVTCSWLSQLGIGHNKQHYCVPGPVASFLDIPKIIKLLAFLGSGPKLNGFLLTTG